MIESAEASSLQKVVESGRVVGSVAMLGLRDEVVVFAAFGHDVFEVVDGRDDPINFEQWVSVCVVVWARLRVGHNWHALLHLRPTPAVMRVELFELSLVEMALDFLPDISIGLHDRASYRLFIHVYLFDFLK